MASSPFHTGNSGLSGVQGFGGSCCTNSLLFLLCQELTYRPSVPCENQRVGLRTKDGTSKAEGHGFIQAYTTASTYPAIVTGRVCSGGTVLVVPQAEVEYYITAVTAADAGIAAASIKVLVIWVSVS